MEYVNKLLMIKSYLQERLLYLKTTKGDKLSEEDKAVQDILVTLLNLVEKELKELGQS